MTTGERIFTLRQQRGMTREELAQKVGVQQAAIYKYEKGLVVNLKRSIIEKLAEALQTSPVYLLGIDDEPQNATQDLPNTFPIQPTHRIPVLGRVAAGLPAYAEEDIEGYIWTDRNHGHEYFGLRVQGDSMNAARIQDGDIVIVCKQDTVENGDIAVVIVGDDEATVKRFQRHGSTVMLLPQSSNPVHTAQVYDLHETPIKIIGRVVEVRYSITQP